MRLEEATVMVVDDEPELREIFSAWLGRKGCRVLTASNGQEALKTMQKEAVDVLVSDIRMPVMGGIELVRTICKMDLLIPSIIFVTGFGDVDPREMHALGVEALLEKPLERKNLLRVLDECLMAREDLWLTPLPEPADQSVTRQLESMHNAAGICTFQLGRGGCCFAIDRPLEEEQTIELDFCFAREGLRLKAQGTVRWVSIDASHAGVAFQYVDPGCRNWVIGTIHKNTMRKFIPSCVQIT